MSYFGITAIRWNDDHTEAESCLLHEAVREAGHFVLGEGRQTWYADVVSLIKGGDRVLVMEMNADGEYESTAEVQVYAGSDDYLRTSPESFLFDLPVF